MDTTRIRAQRAPWAAIASVFVALLYDVSPIDLIPDVIPILGWLDDAAISAVFALLAVFSLVKHRRAKRSRQLARL